MNKIVINVVNYLKKIARLSIIITLNLLKLHLRRKLFYVNFSYKW